jgi:predicted metal-dependent hydrolase
LAHYGELHGIKVGKIAIRNQKSRWGSCSKKGNLNFNYKLVFLSPELRDYVIVHEICHIKEFNHGEGFWSLVAEAVPDHRELRKQLKNVR